MKKIFELVIQEIDEEDEKAGSRELAYDNMILGVYSTLELVPKVIMSYLEDNPELKTLSIFTRSVGVDLNHDEYIDNEFNFFNRNGEKLNVNKSRDEDIDDPIFKLGDVVWVSSYISEHDTQILQKAIVSEMPIEGQGSYVTLNGACLNDHDHPIEGFMHLCEEVGEYELVDLLNRLKIGY